jgi:hypothetical protein
MLDSMADTMISSNAIVFTKKIPHHYYMHMSIAICAYNNTILYTLSTMWYYVCMYHCMYPQYMALYIAIHNHVAQYTFPVVVLRHSRGGERGPEFRRFYISTHPNL